jgi:SAM-dependent methyltransferase
MKSRIVNIINYSKDAGKSYGGKGYEFGYHTLRVGDEILWGQRNNAARVASLPYDFKNKIVLDIGCGPGGMLHTLSPSIAFGVGIDCNYRLINLANAVKQFDQLTNIAFYVFDIEKEPITFVTNFLDKYRKIDVCLFLSMAKWIKRWKEVIHYCKSIAPTLVFESNGSTREQTDQITFIRGLYSSAKLVSKTSEDDPKQKRRQLYLCG